MGSWSVLLNNTRHSLARQSQLLARLQEQVSTGVRVVRPSDDPVAARRIAALRDQSDRMGVYLENVSTVETGLEQLDSQLQKVSQVLTDARGHLVQGATGTFSSEQRKNIAEAIDQAVETILLLANYQSAGKYLFGGANTSVAPFAATRVDGKLTAVAYQGSDEGLFVPVGAGLALQATTIGRGVFYADDRQTPIFLGDTGAAAGAGTSTVTGDAWLTLTHDSTSYGGGIDLAPGMSSPEGDTILGNGHTLTVDADAKTLSLDGGPAVGYAPGETDVMVANDAGQVVYLDVSSLTLASGQQTVSVATTAALSIDDGATSVISNMTDANLAVADAAGRILYVDTTGITSVGLEPVRAPGTYDVFSTLISIRDMMANTRDVDVSSQLDLLNRSVSSLDEVANVVSRNIVRVGARMQANETLRQSIEQSKTAASDETAALRDADVVQLATELAGAQNMYQMTLTATARLLSLNLLDFLQ